MRKKKQAGLTLVELIVEVASDNAFHDIVATGHELAGRLFARFRRSWREGLPGVVSSGH